jgi:CheY-like chemotaxis protein
MDNRALQRCLSFLRILVAEDYEPMRRYICIALRQWSQHAMVSEAVDGLESVEKARELQPGLVLLDIGMRRLNGFEAARQIRSVVPNAKLLFVSQESSADMLREAFRLGADGYVHKLNAQRDLVPAIEAILAGKQFVSSGLEYGERARIYPKHKVQFYSDDATLLEGAGPFIRDGLRAGKAAVALMTHPHRESLSHYLHEQGEIDLPGAIDDGTYVSQDVADMTSAIMAEGCPDRAGFLHGLSGLINTAAKAANRSGVVIFGECVGLLCAAGNVDAAIQLEEAGNELLETHDVEIMCAYPLESFRDESGDHDLRSVCSKHTSVHFR